MLVSVIGNHARNILSGAERGSVLAVLRHSFYVQFNDDLVCVGPTAMRAGPLALLCVEPAADNWHYAHLKQKTDAVTTNETLAVGDQALFDFGAAEIWRPPIAANFSRPQVRSGLEWLVASTRLRRPRGFGLLLPDLFLSQGVVSGAAHCDPILKAASTPVQDILKWLATAAVAPTDPPSNVASLIGLGNGLTPSGDDFLCGVMCCLHYFGFKQPASRLARHILPIATENTNLISRAYLQSASAGSASSVLFDALEGICAADGTLEERLDAIDSIGHTSGWDILAGSAIACLGLISGPEAEHSPLSS